MLTFDRPHPIIAKYDHVPDVTVAVKHRDHVGLRRVHRERVVKLGAAVVQGSPVLELT